MFFIPYGTAEKTGRIRFPLVNISIVLVNIGVFLLAVQALFYSGDPGYNQFIDNLAFVPSSLATEGLLQASLLTAMFVHAGLLHLVGNMLFLLPFGDNVEDRLGHAKYFLFYLACGLAATLIYALFNLDSRVPLVGASGAIAGVLGGYLALHPTGSTVKGFFVFIVIPLKVALPALVFILYWFTMQLISAFTGANQPESPGQGGVAFLAHIAGFVAGFMLAPLFAKPPAQKD